MSKAALLIELGWEPINDFLNRPFSLEDVSHAPQQCEIEGRRTEFHNASPNSTRLRLPCSARIRDMKLILLSILSLIYVWT
jgi:hypothetical protein